MATVLKAGNSTTGGSFTPDNTGILDIKTGTGAGTTAVTVDTSQNVGIGTTTPSTYGNGLVVYNSATGVLRAYGSSVGAYMYASSGGSVGAVGTETNHAFTFNTNNTERVRLDVNGNLLVGTTESSQTSGTGMKLNPAGQGANVPSLSIVGASTAVGATCYHLYSSTGAAYKFYVTYSGVVNATTTTITAISDQRLKENIRDLDDGLEKVLALKPRKFDWKEGKGEDIKNARGFIAQELETVFPDMVSEWIDPAPEGEEPYKAVNANLIPTLVKAIQELKVELDVCKAEIAALKGNTPDEVPQ